MNFRSFSASAPAHGEPETGRTGHFLDAGASATWDRTTSGQYVHPWICSKMGCAVHVECKADRTCSRNEMGRPLSAWSTTLHQKVMQ